MISLRDIVLNIMALDEIASLYQYNISILGQKKIVVLTLFILTFYSK